MTEQPQEQGKELARVAYSTGQVANGHRWTGEAWELLPVIPADPSRNLANTVAARSVDGYRVESQSAEQVIMVKGGNTNHLLHLILTLLTWWFFGGWVFVWGVVAVVNRKRRVILRVDDYGNVLTHQL